MTAISFLDKVQHAHDVRETIREQRLVAKRDVRRAKSALKRAEASGGESEVSHCKNVLAKAKQRRNELLWPGRYPQIH